jgi:hypothetical protein
MLRISSNLVDIMISSAQSCFFVRFRPFLTQISLNQPKSLAMNYLRAKPRFPNQAQSRLIWISANSLGVTLVGILRYGTVYVFFVDVTYGVPFRECSCEP